LSEGVVAVARCHRQKCVQQLRGTRKGGGVFEAVEKARAIYGVKRDEWCVLRFGCWMVDICCWLCGLQNVI